MDANIQAVIAAELPPEDAARVVAALEAITTEPGVGTVARNPGTGDVATYVRQYGETYWRIRSTDDRTWTEFEPLVGWETLYAAEAVTVPATDEPTTKEGK